MVEPQDHSVVGCCADPGAHREFRPDPHPHPADVPFRALLEAAPDAMVIVDDEGRIKLVNAQTESMFGYAREELLGRNVEIL
ncbi:PAS domain S-box protein, partial [Actinocrinis sp.]|uniref:PAS domain S-box protein n=1 Tax=Actinocrinis sp. TaxID=1920516 RepID=UPI002D64BB87